MKTLEQLKRIDDTTGSVSLALTDLEHYYGTTRVLKNITLEVHEKELICLLGPSGCGKTTLLNTMAGFIAPSRGRVSLEGRDVTKVPTHRRGLGMVFQNYSLLPHMTVYENIAFGLNQRRIPKQQHSKIIKESLEAVQLAHKASRYPTALSGGEQQRVGLARALAVRPKVLLLDEPLSNLDALLRRDMQSEIRRIHDAYDLTSVYVTHDQEEAMQLGDRVAVMNNGIVEQLATPRELYENPASLFVARFLGERNFIPSTVQGIERGELVVVPEGTSEALRVKNTTETNLAVGDKVELAVREESLRVVFTASNENRNNCLPMRVVRKVYRGATTQVEVKTGEMLNRISIKTEETDDFEVGDDVYVWFPPHDIRVFASERPDSAVPSRRDETYA